MNKEDPKPEEEVCFNCKHLFWGIGLGLGLDVAMHSIKRLIKKNFYHLFQAEDILVNIFQIKKIIHNLLNYKYCNFYLSITLFHRQLKTNATFLVYLPL